MINTILSTSKQINNSRTTDDVFKYVIEEIGELSTELNIISGYSAKEPGKDGVVGEAIDAILCLVDLIYLHAPNITEEQLLYIAENKLTKWANKCGVDIQEPSQKTATSEIVGGMWDVLAELGATEIHGSTCLDYYTWLSEPLRNEIEIWGVDTLNRDAAYLELKELVDKGELNIN